MPIQNNNPINNQSNNQSTHQNISQNVNRLANFIWSIADLLRGDFKQADYGKIILPLTVLRRMDCVIEPQKNSILNFLKEIKNLNPDAQEKLINNHINMQFHNISNFTFQRLLADPNHIAPNLRNFINGFSSSAREIIQRFNFDAIIDTLDRSQLLFPIIQRFAGIDMHHHTISSMEMGYVFEELIRKFSELSNETAGEHFTPREVIRLMVNLLFTEDNSELRREGIIRTLYDPACGTGGMLAVAEEYLRELNPDASLKVFGQELNPESYAVCKADMLIKNLDFDNIKFGNTFTEDQLPDLNFDYMLSNPPFGVEWRKVEDHIKREHEERGYSGRFGAGLPRISDGSLLFLQHMIAKRKKPSEGGSRIAIVFNGSPLFSGGAGSGESDIRRWIIANDMLEAVVALPDQLFYNTGIYTYIWMVTNRKDPRRKGKVQLINGVSFFQKMSRSLGNKRNEISQDQLAALTRIYGDFVEGECCKIFDNDDFGYHRITVERPLRLRFRVDAAGIGSLERERAFIKLVESKKKGERAAREVEEGQRIQAKMLGLLRGLGEREYGDRKALEAELKQCFASADMDLDAPLRKALVNVFSHRDEGAPVSCDRRGNVEADPQLRDYENVPLKEDIHTYFRREVLPHVPDAWIDEDKTQLGYEIGFTRYFYQYRPLRGLEAIRADILALEQETDGMLQEVLN